MSEKGNTEMNETKTIKTSEETVAETATHLSGIILDNVDEDHRNEIAQVVAATCAATVAHHAAELKKATQYAAPKNWLSLPPYRDAAISAVIDLGVKALFAVAFYMVFKPKQMVDAVDNAASTTENPFSETAPRATRRPSAVNTQAAI